VNKKDLKIGQVVWVEILSNHVKEGIERGIVSKIENKWFNVTLDKYEWFSDRYRFNIDTLNADGKGYSSPYRVVLSLQVLEDEKEHGELSRQLYGYFPFSGSSLPLEKLRKIKQIIKEE
jgi:hypothetical protein